MAGRRPDRPGALGGGRLTLLGAALALLSAAAWGTGDFCGGLATRRVPVLLSVLAVQAIGTLLALGVRARRAARPRPAGARSRGRLPQGWAGCWA